MAYNPYSAVNAIYKLKGQWNNANNAGDTTTKNNVAAKAQAYYNQLRSNGYGDIADELTASNYAQAKEINDKWAKTGKTKTRDYLYSLGQSRGMTSSDVDKLISWDDQSKEVSFGGKKIGAPDAIVDGTSYWSDTSVLDNAFNDYIKRTGSTLSDKKMSELNTAGVSDKINELWGMHKEDRDKYNSEYDKVSAYANSDVTQSDEYKSAFEKIMPKYDLAGLQSRDNAVASNAGSNGGNIDSFAAANALRQQAALTAQGQALAHQTGLEAWQARIQNARALLSDLGVQQINSHSDMRSTIDLQQKEAQRLFENDETAKNNDVARKSEIASVSGYTPIEWNIQNDAFLKQYVDDEGKLKPEYTNTDFQALINNAKANGNTELADKYSILRGLKISGYFDKFGQYLNEGDISYVKPNRTAEYDLTKQQIDSAERISKANNDANLASVNAQLASAEKTAELEAQNAKDLAAIQAQSALDQIDTAAKYDTKSDPKPTITAAQAAAAIKNGEKSQSVIDAYNYYYGTAYTVDNPPNISNDDNLDLLNSNDSNTSDIDYGAQLDSVYNDSSKTVKNYIRNVLEPLVTQNNVTEEELKNHLISNSKKYDLEVDDIKAICKALGVDAKWVDNYKNAGLFGWGSGVKER